MVETSDSKIEAHFNNRLSFISLITGFLLAILVQIAFISKDFLSIEQIRILNYLFISILLILFSFLFSFLLLLMGSSELSKENKDKNYIDKCIHFGTHLALIGVFGFALIFFYLISWYFYPDKLIANIICTLYLAILIILYFLFNWYWRPQIQVDPGYIAELKKWTLCYFILSFAIIIVINII